MLQEKQAARALMKHPVEGSKWHKRAFTLDWKDERGQEETVCKLASQK